MMSLLGRCREVLEEPSFGASFRIENSDAALQHPVQNSSYEGSSELLFGLGDRKKNTPANTKANQPSVALVMMMMMMMMMVRMMMLVAVAIVTMTSTTWTNK